METLKPVRRSDWECEGGAVEVPFWEAREAAPRARAAEARSGEREGDAPAAAAEAVCAAAEVAPAAPAGGRGAALEEVWGAGAVLSLGWRGGEDPASNGEMAAVREVRVAIWVAESERGGGSRARGGGVAETSSATAWLGTGGWVDGLWEEAGGSEVKAVIVRQVPFTEIESPREASERISGQEVMVREVPWPPASVRSEEVRAEMTVDR